MANADLPGPERMGAGDPDEDRGDVAPGKGRSEGREDPPPAGVLLGEERLPGPSATPAHDLAVLGGPVLSARRRAARALLRERENTPGSPADPLPRTPRTPRIASTAASRPSLSGPDLRPIPRAPETQPRPAAAARRRDGEGAPAAPRPGGGVAYPMPGYDVGPGFDDEAIDRGEAPPPSPGLRPNKLASAPFPRPHAPVHLSPRMTAVFGALFGLATVTSVIALLIQQVPPRDERALVSGSATAFASSAAPSRPEPTVKKRVRTPIPGPWRLSELEKDPSVAVERGTMDKKSLFDALGEKGVPKSEVYRIIKSLDGVRKFDKTKKKDRFAVAFERSSKRVKAFEYATSASDIWQAREGDNGLLTGQKLDMKLGEEEYSGAFYVSNDVTASFKAAGFEDGLLAALDEALTGHMSTEGFEEGGTVRVIAVEETALGLFSRYKRVIAMEYRPADPAGKPVRIYNFNGQEAHGYWDDKGRQPNSGGWRSPVPNAPITSHFNPKRMHPVLHTIMPHTGTDFGAPSGTPIYAAYRGTIISAAPAGPCGNTVQIQHANGIVTGYCHMSRFANVKAGEKVGTRQLIGYVGTTGRSTGPHLHFFVKKNGQFVDSRTLHIDGDRPVPAGDRTAFLAAKAELDRRLDAIPLPEPPPPPEKPVAAAAGSASAAADAPPPAKEAKESEAKEPAGDSSKPSKGGGRRAVQIGSPDAIAAAKAEPGIHPSQFVEMKGDDDDDDPGPTNAAPPPTKDKPKGAQDPSEEEDDEK